MNESGYIMYCPHQHLSQSFELSHEQWKRVKGRLSKSDLAALENGGRVKIGRATEVWKQ